MSNWQSKSFYAVVRYSGSENVVCEDLEGIDQKVNDWLATKDIRELHSKDVIVPATDIGSYGLHKTVYYVES